jgi:hypothetical protein
VEISTSNIVSPLSSVFETIRDDSRRWTFVSVETVRLWHTAILRGFTVPDPRYIGRFRGETGLEKVQVQVSGRFGVAARDVSTATEPALRAAAQTQPAAGTGAVGAVVGERPATAGREAPTFILIDGYKRVRALKRLARDTVRATSWQMAEAEALLLDARDEPQTAIHAA